MFAPLNQQERQAMTEAATYTTAIALDPSTLGVLLHDTVDSLPCHPQASVEEKTGRREAACIALAALGPRDPCEARLAAGIVAAHYHMMDNLRCAADLDMPAELRLRFQGRAITLHKLSRQTQKDLELRQAQPAVRPTANPVPVPEARPAPPPTPVKQPAAPVARPAAPVAAPVAAAHPAAPVPAAVPAAAVVQGPAVRVPEMTATREMLLAEIARRAATSIAALAT
jgi:hypothetical protein